MTITQHNIARTRHADQRGFTLIELSIASLVAAIIIVGIASYLGNVGTRAARAYLETVIKDDVGATIKALEWDIRQAGTGIPDDVMALDQLGITNPALTADPALIADSVWRDQDNVGATGSDVVRLGGIAVEGGPTGTRNSVVVADAVTPSMVSIARQDSIDVPLNYAAADRSYLDPVIGEYVSVLDPDVGWRSPAPLLIRTIEWNPATPGVFDLTLDGNFTTLPQFDDFVYFHRAVNGITPGHLEQAVWALNIPGGAEVGTLARTHILDVANAGTTALPAVVMLDNVADFQVSFLIWACGDAAPSWIDHLWDPVANTGAFATGGCYNPNPGSIGDGDRFMAMRARLIGVRATIVVREREPRAQGVADNPQFDPNVPGQITVDNNTRSGLDQSYRYYVIEQVFDPYNLRLKTPTSGVELYPPVRDQATASATFTPAGGFYTGRNSNAGS